MDSYETKWAETTMFSHITIFGIGIIGGSLCKAIRRTHPAVHLTGVDLPHVVQEIRKTQIVDRAESFDKLASCCKSADLLVLATPIRQALELLPDIAKHSISQAVITDVCSLKTELVQTAESLFSGENGWFVGGHPMAGSEHSGFRHADPFLFENTIYVLSPANNIPEEKTTALAKLVDSIGAQGIIVSPDVHDRLAAAVSHLPQMLAIALMNYVAGKNDANILHLKMAAGGFRDMTRIASSPFTMWRDICAGNRENITAEINGFINALQDLCNLLKGGELEQAFDNAARNRLSIPKDTRGFLTRHFDLSVVVEDRPGVIAEIAVPLAECNINIKDIEVLKVRENEGGTIRLAFASAEKRKQARSLLESIGMVCQEK
ncbi:MAG: prephenate dehydrogenase/arogenate dehydrogenase family protein [bacterium]